MILKYDPNNMILKYDPTNMTLKYDSKNMTLKYDPTNMTLKYDPKILHPFLVTMMLSSGCDILAVPVCMKHDVRPICNYKKIFH